MKRTIFKRKLPSEGAKGLKRTSFKQKPSKTVRKRKRSLKRMIYGVKVWSMKQADIYFSKWLRASKNYTCEMCGFRDDPPTRKIHCSHYIGRSHKATRYDPENCDVLCASCHSKMEDVKQYEYRDWKIAKMGEEAHEALRQKDNSIFGEKDAIYNCMKLLGKL